MPSFSSQKCCFSITKMQYNKLIMIFLCALDKNALQVYVFLWVHFLSDTFRTPSPDVTDSSLCQNTKQRHHEKQQYQRITRSKGVSKGCWGTERALDLPKKNPRKNSYICVSTERGERDSIVCWPKTSTPPEKALSNQRAEN